MDQIAVRPGLLQRTGVNHFEGDATWHSFLANGVFAGLKPGEPFLIIERLLEVTHDRISMTHRSGEHEMLKVKSYIGWLANEEPLIRLESPHEWAMVIATKRFISRREIPAFRGLDDLPRAIRITELDVHDTPLDRPFMAPNRLEYYPHPTTNVTAFEIGVGVEAMEKLCVEETARRADFGSWYVKSTFELGIRRVSDKVIDILSNEKRRVLNGLLDEHHKIVHRVDRHSTETHESKIHALMKEALELEMGDDHQYVVVHDLSYVPSRVLCDLTKRYFEND